MSEKRSIGVLGAILFAAITAVTFSQSARAETGFLWLDSAYAVPAHHISYTPHWKRAGHTKRVGASTVSYVAPPSRPQIIQVAAAAPVRSECFWCNVRISGLSF
jgi:hypothetical protein